MYINENEKKNDMKDTEEDDDALGKFYEERVMFFENEKDSGSCFVKGIIKGAVVSSFHCILLVTIHFYSLTIFLRMLVFVYNLLFYMLYLFSICNYSLLDYLYTLYSF